MRSRNDLNHPSWGCNLLLKAYVVKAAIWAECTDKIKEELRRQLKPRLIGQARVGIKEEYEDGIKSVLEFQFGVEVMDEVSGELRIHLKPFVEEGLRQS